MSPTVAERGAFVAGATGLTGREVVAQLRGRGAPTTAHVRPDSPRLPEWRQRFEPLGAEVDTTPWDPRALTDRLAMLRPGVVFALLGTTRRRAREAARRGQHESYETVDYGLSRMLLDAAVGSGARPLFVYLSSMGVTPRTRNPYLAVRHRFEAELRDSGLPWIIARPSFIAGPRDEPRPAEELGIAVGDAVLGVVGALGGRRFAERYRSQSHQTLARALVTLALGEREGLYESDALRRAGGAT